MSRIYVTGPADISVGTGTDGALEHLGWSTRGFPIQLRPYFEDIQTDLTGPSVPGDVMYAGMDAIIRIELARFNWGVLEKLQGFLRGATSGEIATATIGTLLRCEGAAVRLLIRAPFASKTDCFPDMPPAWNFLVAYLAEPIEIPVGTRASTPSIAFRAIPDVQSTTSGGVLFDEDVTGAPALN